MKKTLFLFSLNLLLSNFLLASGHQVSITLAKHVTCGGFADGKIYATVTGGVGPFEYAWTPIVGTADTLDNVYADTYSCTVTDLSDMSVALASIVVDDGDWLVGLPLILFSSPSTICEGEFIQVSSGGIVTPNSYNWTGPNNFTANFESILIDFVTPAASGWYYVSHLSEYNCLLRDSIHYTVNPAILLVGSTAENITCPGAHDAWVNASVSGGTAPFTYYFNNVYTTDTAFAGLGVGLAAFKVVDAAGCSDSLVLYNADPDPISVNASIQNPTDSVSCNGSITAIASGGAGMYNYMWSPAVSSGSLASNICSGTYTVIVTDYYRCPPAIQVINICNNGPTISGHVFHDKNDNCLSEVGEEHVLPMTIVAIDSNNVEVAWAQVNNQTGSYQLSILNSIGTYTLQLKPSAAAPDSLYTFNCSNDVVTISHNCDTVLNRDLGYNTLYSQELGISLFSGVARPGFIRSSAISYSNFGADTLNATIHLKLDSLETFVSATPLPTIVSGNVYSWSLGNLVHGDNGRIYFTSQIPTIQAGGMIGTILNDSAWITPIAGDENITNNYAQTNNPIRGSYDPNEKEVTSANMNIDGSIDTSMTSLVYTVYFQNTGTDTAFNIKVRDNISTHLQLSTLEILNASHPYSVKFLADRTIELSFDNILLPDSNINEELSHGYFQYRILTNNNIAVDDSIFNKADIYFDFNLPVETNTTMTPVKLNVVGMNKSGKLSDFVLYPNPTNSKQATCLWKTSAIESGDMNIYDISGKLIKTQSVHSNTKNTVDLSGLSNGIYFYSVHTGEGKVINGKVILVD